MEMPLEPQYADYITAYNNFMQPALMSALAAFSPQPGSKGLDAGCGPGNLFDPFSEMVGASGHVTCIDLSTAHLKEAAERALTLQPIEVIMNSIDLSSPLDFESDSFDWVWCADVLWPSSFEKPEAVIAEFARITRLGGKVALFCNGWQRTLLSAGHRHLEFDLIKVSDVLLRPPKSSILNTDIEYMAGWLRQAGLKSVQVTAHTVSYAWPLPQHAKTYVDCVLTEDYLPALEVLQLSAAETERIRKLLTPGQAEYIPDQSHYFCCKTGILAVGQV